MLSRSAILEMPAARSGRIKVRTPEILKLIGNTPMVRLDFEEISPEVSLMAKLEVHNPGGSVKDRAANQIVLDALEAGELRPGRILLDSTSGNTGVAYALIGAAMGLEVTLCVPQNVSEFKRKLIGALGTRIIETDPLEGSDGAQLIAESMAQAEPGKYFYADQYSNPANPKAHFTTTGPEIWRQTYGQITHLVAGIGTSGTVMGLSEYFKQKNPGVQIVGVEPPGPMHGLEGLKHLETSIVPKLYRPDAVDYREYVQTQHAYYWVDRLAKEKGLLVGPSSGAAMSAGVAVASKIEKGIVVMIFPDGGERYLPR